MAINRFRLNSLPCGQISRFFLHVLLPIVAGGVIYTGWRTETLLCFTWIDNLGLSQVARHCRAVVADVQLPHILLYTTPDAFWVYASTAYAALIWESAPTTAKGRRIWLCVGVGLGVFGELGQGVGLVPGTFDWADLGAISAAMPAATVATVGFRRAVGKA
jgi:hypothetical protein